MKKLVILTGAGMSAESGISTFRDAGGLWEKYPIEDVATPQAWAKNPALVLDFYNQRRRQLLEVEPNAGHFGLAELEKHFDVHIVTQNVDNFSTLTAFQTLLGFFVTVIKYANNVNKCPVGTKCW